MEKYCPICSEDLEIGEISSGDILKPLYWKKIDKNENNSLFRSFFPKEKRIGYDIAGFKCKKCDFLMLIPGISLDHVSANLISSEVAS